jgi:nucleotide-binding universal stress UspA family protein
MDIFRGICVNAMTTNTQREYLEHEKVKLEPTTQSSGANKESSVSMEKLPSFGKILITDDGTDEQNNVLKYAVSVSKYTGAELLILRVVKDMKKIEGISVQGSSSNKHTTQEVKGGIVDEMEEKIKRCKEAGCEKNISYKFRIGDAIEQILSEVKDGNYDLLILRSTNLDSWMKSVFSNARKIISSINIPVLIVH